MTTPKRGGLRFPGTWLLCLLGCACAHVPSPEQPAARSLYRDAVRVAELRSESGWVVDRT